MERIKIYGYRWIVLIAFMIANIMTSVHWINLAPITLEASKFYNVSELYIAGFSLIYMIIFIILCIPASYVIDRFGLRIGVGTGVVLTGVFGYLKGRYASSFNIAFICQCGLAAAQPFILNAVTKVGAKWFPIHERATAAGLATLAQYIGIIVAMVLSPILYAKYGIASMLNIYGLASLVVTVLFFVLIRENPPTLPSTIIEDENFQFFVGLKNIFMNKDMLILLALFFIGLGMFNAVTTWIEPILSPRGINSDQAGLIGAAMMFAGILGALILPLLSDKLSKRKLFMVIAMIGTVPGLIGLTYATNFILLIIGASVLGFFMMAAGPIGFQYGAEMSYPTPESTSQGIILLMGQVSGIIFIFAMDALKAPDGSMSVFMTIFVLLMILAAIVSMCLKESELIKIDDTKI